MREHAPIKDASTLGRPKMLILGLQHLFAMFGATILVPILVNNYFEGQGLSIQVTLFFAGIGTLFFHLCSKFKVPAFLGSSFAFLGGFHTVANLNTGIFKNMTMGEKLPYACGGIVVAGLLYLVLAVVIKMVGIKKVMKFLPPVVTGPIIICIGLSLAPSAITNASQNWLLAIVAGAVILVLVAYVNLLLTRFFSERIRLIPSIGNDVQRIANGTSGTVTDESENGDVEFKFPEITGKDKACAVWAVAGAALCSLLFALWIAISVGVNYKKSVFVELTDA